MTRLRRLLRNQSIKRKLMAIVVVTSGVAVVLASAAFLAYDYNSFRERMVTDLATTADGVGLLAWSALDSETASGASGGVGRASCSTRTATRWAATSATSS